MSTRKPEKKKSNKIVIYYFCDMIMMKKMFILGFACMGMTTFVPITYAFPS